MNTGKSPDALPVNIFIGGAIAYKQALKLKSNLPDFQTLFKSGQSIADSVERIRNSFRGEEIDLAPIMMWAQVIKTEAATLKLRILATDIMNIIMRATRNLSRPADLSLLQILLKDKDSTVTALVNFFLRLDTNREREGFIEFLSFYKRKAIIKCIPAQNTKEALKAVNKLKKNKGIYIKNIIIDCHGYYYKTAFYVGDQDKLFYDGSVKKNGVDFTADSAVSKNIWSELSAILNSGKGSVILNACYGGNDRNSWSYKRIRKEKTNELLHDLTTGNIKPAEHYQTPLPDRDEGEILMEKLFRLMNEGKFKDSVSYIQPVSEEAASSFRHIYASKSWFLSKPGVMTNIPLVEIQMIIMGLAATQAGREFMNSYGNMELGDVKRNFERALLEEMGFRDASTVSRYFIGEFVERLGNAIENNATNFFGANPFEMSLFEFIAYGVLPMLYYSVPLVITPGGIDEPDYYLLGANVGGNYISPQEQRRPYPEAYPIPADYYRRYEWENAGKWVRSDIGEYTPKTYEPADFSSKLFSSTEGEEYAYTLGYTPLQVNYGFNTRETGTLIYYYNGDFSVSNSGTGQGITKWHDTFFGKLWTNLAHQISLDSEIGLTKQNRSKPKIKKYTPEEQRNLMSKDPVKHYLKPDFF